MISVNISSRVHKTVPFTFTFIAKRNEALNKYTTTSPTQQMAHLLHAHEHQNVVIRHLLCCVYVDMNRKAQKLV